MTQPAVQADAHHAPGLTASAGSFFKPGPDTWREATAGSALGVGLAGLAAVGLGAVLLRHRRTRA